MTTPSDQAQLDKIQHFYERRIEQHGLNYQAVWGDDADWKAAQRFSIIQPRDLESGDIITDLGAGTGPLKDYLDQLPTDTTYVAVDACDTLLQSIAERHGISTHQLNFVQQVQDLPASDWYAIFGSINKKWLLDLDETDSIEPVYQWLEQCYAKARKGIFLSAFSSHCTAPKPDNVHLDPWTIITRLGQKTPPCFRLDHSHNFYEFTLMVRS